MSVANIGHLPGSPVTRGLLTARFLANTTYLYQRLHGRDDSVWRRSFAGRGLAMMRDVQQAVATSPDVATAYFVHLLLPHRPLEVDSACNAYPALEERIDYDTVSEVSDDVWHHRLSRYAAQVRCAHRALAELIDAIDSRAGRHGSIIVVHGDHGSRLTRRRPGTTPLADFDLQQLNAYYSTLLAVRRPHTPASLRQEPVPVQDFFKQLVERDFQGSADGPWAHYVMRTIADTLHGPAERRTLAPLDIPWSISAALPQSLDVGAAGGGAGPSRRR